MALSAHAWLDNFAQDSGARLNMSRVWPRISQRGAQLGAQLGAQTYNRSGAQN